MMAILRSEWLKLRKSKILYLLLAGPIVGIVMGLTSSLPTVGEVHNEWYIPLFSMNLSYGLLFLPLITGVLGGVICLYEHQAGGWKQLLSLPVTRYKVFIAKFVLLISIVLIIQLLYLVAIYIVGMSKEISDPFPIDIIWKSILGGWIATFPLVALQLWMSILFKRAAASFTINVIFTLPAIFAVNSEEIGPYYPWGQPFYMMHIGSGTEDVFFVPWDQLLTVVGGSFLLFFIGGLIYFQKKTV